MPPQQSLRLSAALVQAVTEWLTDFTSSMTAWEGSQSGTIWTKIKKHGIPLLFTLGGAFSARHPHGVLTKTQPKPSEFVKKACVEKGFEAMYRRFTATTGNTLSMQVGTWYGPLHAQPLA